MRSNMTGGTPTAIASLMTSPHLSALLGSTMMSAA